ncbi:MAG: RNA polymerase sigma factor RpoE [Halorhodospira halophila]|uniref:RNA polymerase sigma factor RpoE n=1 Tax=Halorhodospira TaxID=85108 RepID=UPI00191137A2|nr:MULTISPECIES: RNA polymerase sigma factor RpoE [Halorhodospira]MBK5936910.1 RNA polymerase sigma factor RpoE [Halorhodospira halophila]MBK5942355.1 RNA polymerase sigma factor RpoE [Halorhodospira halophila]MCC3750304.1 RNA polymerase sigma factor RpoE [Halorhodospira halophila]MCG5528137.1 RNA polymerase sigma factor RpoE [Halorhodospira halophila]MCG5531906.1 RNA polymerase sigma factor RpoE [Halorhodospira sp. 9621]
MSSEESDRELVERVQAGDKQAFDLLVLRYQQKLVKLISRYVRDPQEAMDVAQEAFIKAYRAIPGFRGESSFYTWLYRIGVNTAKNHLVAQGRRPPDSDVDAQDAERFDIDTMLREQDTPEAEAYRDEVERTVVEAIAELPEELRTAVTLRELEGLSYQEIAQVMECPVGTVRSRIFRAREAIDKRLRPLTGEET